MCTSPVEALSPTQIEPYYSAIRRDPESSPHVRILQVGSSFKKSEVDLASFGIFWWFDVVC